MTTETLPVIDYSGSFRLIRKIAEGGMATVYEAEQLGPSGFSKRTALKVIHEKYARRPEWLGLFLDEAKLSANLIHGNVVQIYLLGEVNGDYFIAMEFIRGPTLRAVIDRHRELGAPIPPALAAYAVSRVCRALDFAHNFVDPAGRRLDIVHRDVSPGNIMATWDGHIKLADFGIAKARTSFDPAAERTMLLGKKHYMSPEQLLGLDVQAPSDVFSIGVVLFELLSLDRLFVEEKTAMAIEEVAMQPTPDVRARIPGLDPELERLLKAALEHRPENRPTAADMGHGLDRWCSLQHEVGSPDRLQEHLAFLFPASYQPESLPFQENTSFKNLRHSVGARPGFLTRWFSR